MLKCHNSASKTSMKTLFDAYIRTLRCRSSSGVRIDMYRLTTKDTTPTAAPTSPIQVSTCSKVDILRNMGNAPPFILKLASILGMNQMSTDLSPRPPPDIVILPCTVATSGFENLLTLMPLLSTWFQRRLTMLSAGGKDGTGGRSISKGLLQSPFDLEARSVPSTVSAGWESISWRYTSRKMNC